MSSVNFTLSLIRGLMFDHAKTNLCELAHRPTQSRHRAFAALAQTLVEHFDIGVVLHRDDRPHVELGPHTSGPDLGQMRLVAHRVTGLMFAGNDPQVGGELRGTVKALAMVQQGDHAHRQHVANAGNGFAISGGLV